MTTPGDRPQRDILAMARGKSPWGGKRGGESAEDAAAPPPDEDGEVKEAEAPAEKPARNPWLPPADGDNSRRSARIEDILRQRRAPGGKGGNFFPPLPGGDQARTWLPWVIAGSAVLLALSTSIHVIDQGQSGSVATLGRYSRSIGPGMHLTMPWPVETVTLRGGKDGEVLSMPEKGGEMLLLTRDGELIDLAYQVRWEVNDGRRFASGLADPEATLRSLAQAEMRAGIAELPFDAIFEGKRQAELQQRVAGRVQRALDAMRAGIKIDSLEIDRTGPPPRLAEAFKKVGAARADAERLRNEAEKWASQTRNNARVEAASFNKVYDQYKLAPQVIRKRMYYETMERVLRNNKNVVVGGTEAAPVGANATSPAGGQ